ncbi:uncharacterized protein [Branchiostoma lanceolatum]|uniref:uncharacterized protein n=1 Tax=Branchiostoma lanceolatum TaxID=7740 RepID=UPI00345616AF
MSDLNIAWIAFWTAVAVGILLLIITAIALCCCLCKTWKKSKRVDSEEDLIILSHRDSTIGRPRPQKKLPPSTTFPDKKRLGDITKNLSYHHPQKLSSAVSFASEKSRSDIANSRGDATKSRGDVTKSRGDITKKSPLNVSLTDVETVVIPRPYVRSYNSTWDPLDF